MSDPSEPRPTTAAQRRTRATKRRSDKLRNAGFAVGIGSAAIVAALLYASKVGKPPRNGA